MAKPVWLRKYLTDEELLSAAEEVVKELELDNKLMTDEEESDGEPEVINTEIVLPECTENDQKKNDVDNTEKSSKVSGRGKKKNMTSKDEPDRKWKKKNVSTDIPPYLMPEGPVAEQFINCRNYVDYFLTLVGTDTIENVVFQSNLYGTQRNKTLNLKTNELLAFIGINFFMGYHSLPSYKNYWSSAEDLGVPIVGRTMTRNRFQQILSLLHINDNTTIPAGNKDKIFKIRPLVNSLNNQFDSLYHGSRELSVDESMILFKGRSSLKQFNPMKPIKRGYKICCIADQNGYVKNFQIYQGKDEIAEEKFENFGLGERVVLSLTEKYWRQGRIIYFDNYFTSVPLLEKLKTEQTLACGTIRINKKGLPKNLRDEKKNEKR